LKKTPKKTKKTSISASAIVLKRPGIPKKAQSAQKRAKSDQAHASRRQVPRLYRHMRLAHGSRRPIACKKSHFCELFAPWKLGFL